MTAHDQMTLKISRCLTALSFITAIACHKNRGGDGGEPDPQPETQETPEPVSSPETPLAQPPRSFQFTATDVELPGDFRAKKVVQTGSDHYIVAFVSDIRDSDGSNSRPGYMLIKFDAAGREVWRFPTRENVAHDDASEERQGSYLLGFLVDMAVSKGGEILLIGLRKHGIRIVDDNAWPNYDTSRWPTASLAFRDGVAGTPITMSFANIAFVSKIDGRGNDIDSPRFIFHRKVVAPVWWLPQAIRGEIMPVQPSDHDALDQTAIASFVIESSSGGSGGVVQQAQRVDANFGATLTSTCYISEKSNASSGPQQLVNIAINAPESLVAGMTAGANYTFTSDAAMSPEQFAAVAVDKQRAQGGGHCWDLMGGRVMPTDDPSYRIVKPIVAAAGQVMTSQIDSQLDLLSGDDNFDAYPITNRFLAGSTNWTADPLSEQYPNFESSNARWLAIDGEMVHVGLGQRDHLGYSQLMTGNGQTFIGKSWLIDLQTNNQRHPAAIDLLSVGDSIFVAWTDMHLSAETHALHRSLRIAAIHKETKAQQDVTFFEFSVPASTGHRTFSSARMAPGPDGFPTVFATVATREAESSAYPAKMQAATLLIGSKR